MVNRSEHQAAETAEDFDSAEVVENVRPIPRVSIQAFCESDAVCATLQNAAKDRRVAKANFKVNMGGHRAALDHFSSSPTPNLVIIETRMDPVELMEALDRLADVCDPGSKVVVIGHFNDVHLYRELMRCGISEYLVAPISLADVIGAISDIFTAENAEPLGRSIAFLGARGGVGSSTVAHNVAWSISQLFEIEVILADCDLAFGTANIDFDRDPPQGMFEALTSYEEMDETLLDRLLSKCGEHLSLLTAPSTLDRTYEFDLEAYRILIETAQRTAPVVALDTPHLWTDWTRSVLSEVDQVVLTATPDLANLRNAKNIIDTLAKLRPNDAPPALVLNQVGIAKKPEIAIEEFCEPLNLKPSMVLGFDPELFGNAANGGMMIRQSAPRHEIAKLFDELAHQLTGRGVAKTQKKPSLFDRLGLKAKKKAA
ncbi:pilus assembly protein, response regulator protein [Fulvimarina pelagi HTCC2506]|uniref:Pilus assembly protein, response regulator protein n=1 Tax=Fulvimarina pelagi HTCC2506 TaxID=314231 RepID=Q0G4Q6_9HYPH|nr:pilus assembly regulator protein [Fulvimarina pelagi]EAU43358.1 pilus assembly protein, response regulator protein [Fulvimarina pelagi HTCC2506]